MSRVEEYELAVKVAKNNLKREQRVAKGIKTPLIVQREMQVKKCEENLELVKKGLL